MKHFIKYLKQRDRLGGTPPSTTPPVDAATLALAQQLAAQIVADQQAAALLARNGRVFTKFDMTNDVVSNQTEVVTAGLFNNPNADRKNNKESGGEVPTQKIRRVQ